jgi:hypothetical protein
MQPSPEEGKYGWQAQCAPGVSHWSGRWDTFSVGIFQWIPKASGKGFKKAKSIVRVRGLTDNPQELWAKVQEVISQLNAGTYTGPKSINLAKGR